MIGPEEMLVEMRERLRADPTGGLLAQWIVDKKAIGLSKTAAEEILTVLLQEQQGVTPRSVQVEQMEEAVAGVLDRVVGWCSHNLIYPDE